MARNNLPPPITLDEMSKAISRSGYLIEQRVEPIFGEQGYYVETNPAFKDLTTGKSREYDIFAMTAMRIYKDTSDFIFPIVLCECMNNYQPIVFFLKENPVTSFMYCDDLKCSGDPIKFFQRGDYIDLSDFSIMEKYHHYCKGPFSTQYCTFIKKDKKWIAFHSEEQNDSFNSLIQAVEYSIASHYDKWVIDKENPDENVNIQIYYPIVILQGELYGAIIKNDILILKDMEFVQYRREMIIPGRNEPETYQIDVIREKYLPEYLNILDTEYNRIIKYFRRKKHIVRKSIKNIVDKAILDAPKSYRSIFELKNQ